MNTKSLQCFQVAADEMNFSRAADRLYMTQQSLSAHIKKLEEHFGVLLFERTPHLRLTYAGERMLLHAKNMLACENRLEDDLATISKNTAGKLTIGISRSRAQVFLPLIWEVFYEKNPNINIKLVETISEKMESLLLSGEIDLYVGINVTENKALQIYPLAVEKQFCVVSKEMLMKYFPNSWEAILMSCEKGIGLLELVLFTKIPFILLTAGNRMRTSLDYVLHSQNIVPQCIFETLDQNLIFQFSQKGHGVGIISQSYLYGNYERIQEISSLYVFPISIDAMDITIDLVTTKINEERQYILDFIEITRSVFEEYIQKMQSDLSNQ